MQDIDKDFFIKVTLGCVLGMIAILGILVWLNSSEIVQVSVEVNGIRSSVEMLKCNSPIIRAECSADYQQ